MTETRISSIPSRPGTLPVDLQPRGEALPQPPGAVGMSGGDVLLLIRIRCEIVELLATSTPVVDVLPILFTDAEQVLAPRGGEQIRARRTAVSKKASTVPPARLRYAEQIEQRRSQVRV